MEIGYLKVDGHNKVHIHSVSWQERLGFETGNDPQELPGSLQFIADNGTIILQFLTDGNKKKFTGVLELISLERARDFDPKDFPEDLSASPFKIIMENQDRIFDPIREKLVLYDDCILYHHGIAMSRKGKGLETQLLQHGIVHCVDNCQAVVGFIDAATTENGELKLAPNVASYLLHQNFSFYLTGVVDAPVYDENLTLYSFCRFPLVSIGRVRFVGKPESVNIVDGNAKAILDKVRDLTSSGYYGIKYGRNSHEMIFVRLSF